MFIVVLFFLFLMHFKWEFPVICPYQGQNKCQKGDLSFWQNALLPVPIFFPTDFCRLLGHIWGAGCSPVGEKCPFGHKMGGRYSSEWRRQCCCRGTYREEICIFVNQVNIFMESNIYGREFTPDEKFMQEALKEAAKAAQRDEVPIGAVVVCGGRIIARAHNLTEALSDATAHAEMQAITMAAAAVGGKYLDKCTLYVTVEPCPMCAAALAWSQIKRVVYGASDEKRGYSKFTPSLMHPKTEVTGGVLADECGNVITDFFRQKR
jgi:tRNA(adenine34) deaminase